MPDKFLLFPRTKFVDENSLPTQLSHIASELKEVEEALSAAYKANSETVDKAVQHLAVELYDLKQSAETMLRNLQERHGADLPAAFTETVAKNEARQYYKARKE